VLYFAIAGVRAAVRELYTVTALDACVPFVFIALEVTARNLRRKWIDVVRDWVPLLFVPMAYWNVDYFARPRSDYAFEFRWIRLDKLLLNDWHGRSVIEGFGPVLPSLLEFSYLILYAVPLLLLGTVYLLDGRKQVDRFLFTLFAGTLVTYTLLPLFPSESPRLFFPGQDLPSFTSTFRRANVWLLNAGDIRSSVFPSGHVTAAFSAAFAAMAALPNRRWLGRLLFVLATLVAIDTVYGRYHFAVDGGAGFAISLLGYGISRLLTGPTNR
jgi:membrane-associated phospholipid phosphatase